MSKRLVKRFFKGFLGAFLGFLGTFVVTNQTEIVSAFPHGLQKWVQMILTGLIAGGILTAQKAAKEMLNG